MILQCWQPLTFGNRELFTIVSGTIGFYLSFFLSLSLSVWCQLRKSMSNESKLVALSRSFVRSFISLPVGQIVRTILCYVNVHYIEQQRKHSNTHTHGHGHDRHQHNTKDFVFAVGAKTYMYCGRRGRW